MKRSALVAIGVSACFAALLGCERDRPLVRDVPVRELQPRAPQEAGSVREVVTHLAAGRATMRVIYEPPLSLERPPGVTRWPPDATEPEDVAPPTDGPAGSVQRPVDADEPPTADADTVRRVDTDTARPPVRDTVPRVNRDTVQSGNRDAVPAANRDPRSR